MERSGSFRRAANNDVEHLTGADYSADVGRKRSMVRPERQRLDRDHPQYHYQQVAAQQASIQILPSSTGNEPMVMSPSMGNDQFVSGPLQEISEYDGTHEEKADGSSTDDGTGYPDSPDGYQGGYPDGYGERDDGGAETSDTAFEDLTGGSGPYQSVNKRIYDEMEPDDRANPSPIMPKEAGSSLWAAYCKVLTFPIIPAMMRPFGMKTKERQMAWREKIGLISVILMVAAIVGFLTFGFTKAVCKNNQVRTHVGNVPDNNLVVSGLIYDFGKYDHPDVGSYKGPVLYGKTTIGGKDASFMFQNVNGHCDGLIKPKDGTKIPNKDGKMGWYFPCQVMNLNHTLVSNDDLLLGNDPLYNGWGCHTGADARKVLYTTTNQTSSVYYTWEDLQNVKDHQLLVFNGDVLDLSYLDFLLKDELTYPTLFDELRNDASLRGMDISSRMSYGDKRQAMQCLRELTKVGAIDTETIGCIASQVVLYVSLVFIVGLVVIKFGLACYFRFVIARRQGAFPVSNKEYINHEEAVENWTGDIYSSAPLPRPLGPVDTHATEDPANKRRSMILNKLAPTSKAAKDARRITMTTQNPSMSNSRVVPGGSIYSQPLYRQSMYSRPVTMYSEFNQELHGYPVDADTSYRGAMMDADESGDMSPPQGPISGQLMPPQQSQSSPQYGPFIDRSQSPAPSSMALGPVGGENEYFIPQPPVDFQPFGYPLAHTMCLVTAYSESVEGLRTTLDSIATTEYPNSHKLMVIVCDGMIKGAGNDMSTPDICLSMMKEFSVPPEDVESYSYVSVVSGAKRHNMAKVYAGFYAYDDETVDPSKQQRIPIITIVKTGTPDEAHDKKPGNRGKRDSQIILMTFLERIMFDERMTELDFEIFNGIRSITGIAPDFYELMLMVDADTKVFPDSVTHMVAEMVKDPEIMGLCGETKISNKTESWVTAIQVFEYFISHHQAKAFESVFGGVTCLPGCFSMYRIKSPKGADGYWVPILGNPDIVERYSENVVDTLHKKNLLLLGEDRYLSSLMLRTFPKRKMVFVPRAACKTIVPSQFSVLLSQRRRWINSTIHNLMELVLVRDLCGVFIISMQFVVFIDLVSTLVLPAAISFTIYIIVIAIVSKPTPTVSLILLALILGLPGVLIVVTASRASYIIWMAIYLLALPVWNFVLPMYAYWKFDDFSWGDTRSIEGGDKAGHDDAKGEFDSSRITMKRWREFQRDRARQSYMAPM